MTTRLSLTNDLGMQISVDVPDNVEVYNAARAFGRRGWSACALPAGGLRLPYALEATFDWSLIGARPWQDGEGNAGVWFQGQFYKRRDLPASAKIKTAKIKYSRGAKAADEDDAAVAVEATTAGVGLGYVTLATFAGNGFIREEWQRPARAAQNGAAAPQARPESPAARIPAAPAPNAVGAPQASRAGVPATLPFPATAKPAEPQPLPPELVARQALPTLGIPARRDFRPTLVDLASDPRKAVGAIYRMNGFGHAGTLTAVDHADLRLLVTSVADGLKPPFIRKMVPDRWANFSMRDLETYILAPVYLEDYANLRPLTAEVYIPPAPPTPPTAPTPPAPTVAGTDDDAYDWPYDDGPGSSTPPEPEVARYTAEAAAAIAVGAQSVAEAEADAEETVPSNEAVARGYSQHKVRIIAARQYCIEARVSPETLATMVMDFTAGRSTTLEGMSEQELLDLIEVLRRLAELAANPDA